MRLFNHLTAALLCVIFLLNAQTIIDLPCLEVSVRNNHGVAEFTATELFGEPGQPELPVYTCSVLLSPDADMARVSLNVEDVQEAVISGTYEVKPGLPPMSCEGPAWPQNRNIIDGIDVAVYSTNAIFPVERITYSGFGELNIYKIVDLRINLVRYNPVTKKLYQITQGKLVVDAKKDAGYSISHNTNKLIPVECRTRTKKMVVNYDEYATQYNRDYSFTKEMAMAIITANATTTGSKNLAAFVASKKNRGIDAIIITETEMGGNSAEDIRKWLQDNYQELGLMYVLFIGNGQSNDVPMMNFPDFDGSGDCPSDWAFAQLTGDQKSDKKLELHVGRIPIYNNDLTTMDAILQKTIDYENTSEEDAEWRKNIFLTGPGWNSGSSMACSYMNPVHDEFVLKTPGWKSYRMWGTRWGQPTGGSDKIVGKGEEDVVVAQWKEGAYGVIDFATHGNATSSQDVIKSSHTSSIGNTNPGFVLCSACSNAKITNANNLSYSLLRDCSVGSIAGTATTYYGGDYKTSGSNGAWCYKYGQFIVADKMEIGLVLTAIREHAPSSFGWKNRAPYVLFGDPSIGVYTCNREPFVAIFSPNGGEMFEHKTTQKIQWSDNIQGEVKIELLKDNDVIEELAESTPSNGSLEWEITDKYKKGDDYKIRITSIDSNALKAESNEPFSIIKEYIITDYPYTINFDDLQTGQEVLPLKWEQLTGEDDLNWTVWTGKTPTKEDDQGAATGPDNDHTTQNGNYIYVESSGSNSPDKKATYITPKMNLKNILKPELSFWYHMFSDNESADEMGDLLLDISVDGTWKNDVVKLSGDKGDEWFEQKVDLADHIGTRVIFRFRAVTGSGWASDICIDDFEVNGDGTAITKYTGLSGKFGLHYFNNRIYYQIPNIDNKSQQVSLSLYNLQGKLVRTLFKGNQAIGNHSIGLNKMQDHSKPAAGLYICRMKTDGFTKTITILIQK